MTPRSGIRLVIQLAFWPAVIILALNIEKLAYSCLVIYQDELAEEVPVLVERLTGMPVPDDYDTTITVIVMVIAIYGIFKAFDLLFPGRAKGPIESTQASLLSRAASLTGVTAQRIRDALEVLFTGRSRRTMVSASQKMFAPTRGQPTASIRSERGDILVPHETVHAAQAAAGLPYEEDEEDAPRTASEFHRNVRIVLHAMDKDSKRRGWAGHIPSLFDERIPMNLEKTQRPKNIFGRSEIMGDILLTLEEDEKGEVRPKEFLLIQAYL